MSKSTVEKIIEKWRSVKAPVLIANTRQTSHVLEAINQASTDSVHIIVVTETKADSESWTRSINTFNKKNSTDITSTCMPITKFSQDSTQEPIPQDLFKLYQDLRTTYVIFDNIINVAKTPTISTSLPSGTNYSNKALGYVELARSPYVQNMLTIVPDKLSIEDVLVNNFGILIANGYYMSPTAYNQAHVKKYIDDTNEPFFHTKANKFTTSAINNLEELTTQIETIQFEK